MLLVTLYSLVAAVCRLTLEHNRCGCCTHEADVCADEVRDRLQVLA